MVLKFTQLIFKVVLQIRHICTVFFAKMIKRKTASFVNLATQILEKMFGMFAEEIKEWHRIIKEILNEKKRPVK